MVMKAMREGAKGGIGKFILFGFMGMAVGGLVLMDVGGFFRSGTGNNNVLKIGKQTISIQSFDQDLRRQLSRVGISPQEAYKLGYTNQLLSSTVRENLINQAATQNGITIDKKRVAEHIQSMVSPMVQDGQSARDVLRQILASQGMTESQLVNAISNEMRANTLTKAMSAGFMRVSQPVTDALYLYQNEERTVEYAPILAKDIKDIAEPTDAQLEALYQATKEHYAISETRTVKMLRIKDKALKDTIEISEDELRQTYDNNIDAYYTPEQITLEQALLDTEEQAKAVLTKLEGNKSLKSSVKESAYLGEQSYSADELLDDVKDAVLANKKKGAVIGPVQTPLGWNITVIKEVTPEETKSYKSVKGDIKDELLEIAVLDQKYALAATVDDLLASGASVEEIAEEVPLEITDLGAFNNFGLDAKNNDALKDLEDLRAPVLEASRELFEGETSPVMEMADGSFRAVYLEKLNPKSYQPFADVKDSILKRWMSDQRQAEAYSKARALAADIKNNKTTLEGTGYKIKKAKELKRNDEPKSPLTGSALNSLFEAVILEPVVIDIEGGAAVGIVTETKIPELNDKVKGSDAYKELTAAILEESQREGVTLYLENKRDEIGVKVNQGLLDRIYGAESQSTQY